MLSDLRDALRQLRKASGFTTTAVITLALGIGATTAIFTLVHQVMLKSLPVAKPDELWRIGDKIRCCNWDGYTQGFFAVFMGSLQELPRTRRSSLTWQHYRPVMRRLVSAERGHGRRQIRATGSMYPEISLRLLACSPGSAA